ESLQFVCAGESTGEVWASQRRASVCIMGATSSVQTRRSPKHKVVMVGAKNQQSGLTDRRLTPDDRSFSVRGLRKGGSISMRVQRLNSFNEDGNSRARMEEFAMSEKDRLEHVLLCIFSEAALKSAFYDFLASNCMEHMLSFRDEVEYLKSIPFK
ncbi:unnamed protein product, partial [Heterosigma akashiwo]